MNSVLESLLNGDELSDARLTALASLGFPSVPSSIRGASSTSALAGTGYVSAAYGFGFVTLTFNSLQVSVVDDGSTGSAGQKILDITAGLTKVRGITTNLTFTFTDGWSALATTDTPVISAGSAAHSGGATLTLTKADMLPSTALTITSHVGTALLDNPSPVIALTDSSGGSASATLAAISSTFSQSEVRNSVASLAAQIESLRANVGASYSINATSSAKAVYLNFAANLDPSTGKYFVVTGTMRIAFDALGDN